MQRMMLPGETEESGAGVSFAARAADRRAGEPRPLLSQRAEIQPEAVNRGLNLTRSLVKFQLK